MPTPTAPRKPVLCPECGTPDNATSRSLIRRHRLYSLIPRTILVLALFAILVAVVLKRDSRTYPAGSMQKFEVSQVAVVPWNDLQAAANGQSDGFLTRSARSSATEPYWLRPFQTPTLCATVLSPKGTVFKVRGIGWPVSLIGVSEATEYLDFQAKTDPSAPSSTPWRSSVWESGVLQVYSGLTGSGQTMRRITWNAYGTCLLIVLTIAAAWIGRRVVAPLVRRERGPERAGMAARGLGYLAALAFLLLVTTRGWIKPTYQSESTPLGFTTGTGLTDLDWNQPDIAEMAAGPVSDAAIATRVLAKLPRSSSEKAIVKFVYAASIPTGGGSISLFGLGSSPWLQIQSDARYYKQSAISIDWTWTVIRWRAGNEVKTLALQHIAIAPIVLLLILLHFLTTRTTRFLLLRTAVSRQRKHLCQRCAYPLPIATSAPAPPPAP